MHQGRTPSIRDIGPDNIKAYCSVLFIGCPQQPGNCLQPIMKQCKCCVFPCVKITGQDIGCFPNSVHHRRQYQILDLAMKQVFYLVPTEYISRDVSIQEDITRWLIWRRNSVLLTTTSRTSIGILNSIWEDSIVLQ